MSCFSYLFVSSLASTVFKISLWRGVACGAMQATHPQSCTADLNVVLGPVVGEVVLM